MGDADITLRHIARRRPEDLARAFVPGGRAVEVLGWVDTQVTKLERRLDKALHLRVEGEPRVLHVEFCFALRRDVPDLVFEYLGFLFSALRAEGAGEPVPPIESVAVVLSGRRRRLPAVGKRRTAWPGRRFSGTHFRIDAVYQRTVGELRARGSVLWLVFAPLARDASVAAMREVIADIAAGASTHEERAELFTAFLIMATIDPWGHNLQKELVTMVEDKEEGLLRRTPIIGEMIIEAEQRGEQRGKQRGKEEAVVELLGRLFARRVGRRPTTEEEGSILARARVLGPGEVEDALLDLEGDALVRWLAEPLRAS
ncbi:hypothetical protein SOCE26_026650 [Sorangium cellulosum]|uniref:DUF4351 domain-containing protein n=1 Tax=Sorangium cellulosum TaxID=56 RepID=A0A2L0EPQ7_SORCE|nr:hypothetical protein [Sorangium cellulosum]AUX41255.1 hypothetical protein SOCE26_026650 [Sorangium cellulosum]